MEHKAFDLVGFKATDKGEVEAVFSRFNVIDHDGDVTMPGAFTDGQPVRISAYGHTSWQGALPVGKGTIQQDHEKATLKGAFFMNTTGGRDTFEVVKQMGDLGEWSYGFDTLQADYGEFEGKQVQFLRKLDVQEVSPVLKGAGIGTMTTSVKSIADMTEEQFAEQVETICKAARDRGLPIPPAVAEMVREADRAEADIQKDRGALLMIAALYGDHEEEGT